jgi:guanyl-specific ribonuclease Sa
MPAHARRLIVLLAALSCLLLASAASALAAGGAQTRVRAFDKTAPSLIGSSTLQSPCSRPGSAADSARITAGFCVAAEEAAGGGADVALGPAPENAWNTFDQVETSGSPLAGYKGGGSFANDGRAGSQILPSEGAPYREWDVNPNVQGVDRGGERIVTGSNGTAYYTSNHYQSFTQFWGPGQ